MNSKVSREITEADKVTVPKNRMQGYISKAICPKCGSDNIRVLNFPYHLKCLDCKHEEPHSMAIAWYQKVKAK